MDQLNMYICMLLLKHPDSGKPLAFTSVQIAMSEDKALKQCQALIRKGEFASGTRNWAIESSSVKVVDRETIEQAARQILGWAPPES
jgi:hypothetical protein